MVERSALYEIAPPLHSQGETERERDAVLLRVFSAPNMNDHLRAKANDLVASNDRRKEQPKTATHTTPRPTLDTKRECSKKCSS